MRIAQVAPLAESVPPEGYGGTERVVSYLTEELVRLGHEVTLFATADSETSAESGDYLLFLGRICPEKGPDRAIRIATRAGVPLRIAAKVDEADQKYFETSVRPLLDDPLVDFLGEVGGEEKLQLLAHARALLFPIDWPEPFGLVMIESLACGTPVVARRRGSVPEILRDGETGFVCETDDELCEAVSRVHELDRRRCRADFERRFTDTQMAENYVAVYETIRSCARF
jgi:glycosyltransferase involved in cell wall biosynthesis